MSFSEEVCAKIGNYIYRLIDPRNGETFYVGKGSNNRVFQHAKLNKLETEDWDSEASLKVQRIREIQGMGLEVDYIIHRHGIPDEAVFEVEAAVIDVFPQLTNAIHGRGSNTRGPMSVDEINALYALPAIDWEPEESLILININNIADRASIDAVYKQVQAAWRISKKRAEKAEYVLAVIRGVVVGAFKPRKWVSATRENFPQITGTAEELSSRMGFVGEPAPDHIWEKFVGLHGKRVAIEQMKHVQNPIRYWPN